MNVLTHWMGAVLPKVDEDLTRVEAALRRAGA